MQCNAMYYRRYAESVLCVPPCKCIERQDKENFVKTSTPFLAAFPSMQQAVRLLLQLEYTGKQYHRYTIHPSFVQLNPSPLSSAVPIPVLALLQHHHACHHSAPPDCRHWGTTAHEPPRYYQGGEHAQAARLACSRASACRRAA